MKKLIVVVAISVVLLLAGYLLYRYFFYTCCALPPKTASLSFDPDLLYSARATIGLCRIKQGGGGTCYSKTALYFSGKLVKEWSEVVMAPDGEKRVTYPPTEKTLNKKSMDRIIKQIRESGILTKACEAEPVTDYYVDYFVNLDGVNREIKFPGCESELKAIGKLIDAAE